MTEQDIASITWKFECNYIKDSMKTKFKISSFDTKNERVIAIGYMPNYINARRVVACVNACDGIPTKQLELTNMPDSAFNFGSLQAQCERLLDALKLIERDIEWQKNSPTHRMIIKLISETELS